MEEAKKFSTEEGLCIHNNACTGIDLLKFNSENVLMKQKNLRFYNFPDAAVPHIESDVVRVVYGIQ